MICLKSYQVETQSRKDFVDVKQTSRRRANKRKPCEFEGKGAPSQEKHFLKAQAQWQAESCASGLSQVSGSVDEEQSN